MSSKPVIRTRIGLDDATSVENQSRNARAGSVRAARQAGKKHAAREAIAMTANADPNASRGLQSAKANSFEEESVQRRDGFDSDQGKFNPKMSELITSRTMYRVHYRAARLLGLKQKASTTALQPLPFPFWYVGTIAEVPED